MDFDLVIRVCVLAFFGSVVALALLSLTGEGKKVSNEPQYHRLGHLLFVWLRGAQGEKTPVLFLWTVFALIQALSVLLLLIIVTSRTLARFMTFVAGH
jgi:hypothetical protein